MTAADIAHTTPRAAAEFLIAAAVLATAEPTASSMILGATVSIAGEAVRITAAGYGYNAGELSVRGPYRFMRHPYFFGTTLLYVGLCLAGREPYVMGMALLLLTLAYRRGIRRDDARYERFLGVRFATYQADVPAFMPRLWPARGEPRDVAASRGFSLESAILTGRRRELDALIGLVVGYGLLYLCYKLPARDLFHIAIMVTVGLYLLGRCLYYGFFRRRRTHGRSPLPSVPGLPRHRQPVE
jgi:protein-S-isoprenylcysteine O-methyltransferase Ste14